MSDTKIGTVRNPYAKPVVAEVKLVAEEAVFLNCQESGGFSTCGSALIACAETTGI